MTSLKYKMVKYRKGLIKSIESIINELSSQETVKKPDIDFLKSQLHMMSDKDYTAVMSFIWSKCPKLYKSIKLENKEYIYKGITKIRTGYALRISVYGNNEPIKFYITNKDRDILVKVRHYIKSKILHSEVPCPPGIKPIKSEKELYLTLRDYDYRYYKWWVHEINNRSNKYKGTLKEYIKTLYK